MRRPVVVLLLLAANAFLATRNGGNTPGSQARSEASAQAASATHVSASVPIDSGNQRLLFAESHACELDAPLRSFSLGSRTTPLL